MSKHNELINLVITVESDFKHFGKRDLSEDYGPDCSNQCKHFLKLAGELGSDWGVCTNYQSPRKGLLTYEHMGCRQYEEINNYMD